MTAEMKNRIGIFGVLGGIALLLQVVVAQYVEIQSLHRELRVSSQALKIEASQASDLMYQLQQIRGDQNSAATQNFVAGVAAAVDDRDRYSAIWHNGYDRGSQVQQYADNLDRDRAGQYTRGQPE